MNDECNDQIRRLARAIGEADAVVVGAGSGLSAAAGLSYSGARFDAWFADFAQAYGFRDMYSGGFYPYDSLEEHWAYWSRYIWCNRYMTPPRDTYAKLRALLDGRDFFVITTNVDHQFQLAGFDTQRLFYTQGDYGLWQCSRPCHAGTYENEVVVRQMMEAQGFEWVEVHDAEGVVHDAEGEARSETMRSATGGSGAGGVAHAAEGEVGTFGVSAAEGEAGAEGAVDAASAVGAGCAEGARGASDLSFAGGFAGGVEGASGAFGLSAAEPGVPRAPRGVRGGAFSAPGGDLARVSMRVPSELVPHCPRCGAPMSMNLRADDTFAEPEGWHRASSRYYEFLRRHEGMRVVFLELGVGGNTPVIIKYPFWQMTSQNDRATYACVNLGDTWTHPAVRDRSILIDADADRVLGDVLSALRRRGA